MGDVEAVALLEDVVKCDFQESYFGSCREFSLRDNISVVVKITVFESFA